MRLPLSFEHIKHLFFMIILLGFKSLALSASCFLIIGADDFFPDATLLLQAD